MASLKDQEPTLEVINKEITDAIARQHAASSQIDTKAALLAGVAATAAQFLAGRKDPSPEIGFALGAYIAYGLAFLSALGAYAVARFQDVPDPRGLVRECVQLPKPDTLARLVATRVGAYESNKRRGRRKVLLWWISVCTLTAGLALSTVALVLAPPTLAPATPQVHTSGP